MLRPTRRFAALVGGAALLFLIGTNVQSGWLFVLSALLLGTAIGGLVLPALMLRGIEVTRSAPAEATQGSPAHVRIEVANTARGMRWMLLLEDEHLARARLFVPSVAPGERIALDGERVAAVRGTRASSRVVVSSTAPFGVGRARSTFDVESTTTVLPAWTDLVAPGGRAGVPAAGLATRSRIRRGAGPEYLGIREYRWGDSMRHVHWPSTARTGAVMVRELEEELRASLVIVVDTFADRGRERTPLDRACAVAASVALAAVGEGIAVRLAAAEDGDLHVLDDADPHRILRWLAELPRAGGEPLDGVLAELVPQLDHADGLVVVAPTWRANGTDRLVGALGAAGAAATTSVALIDAEAFDGDATAPLLAPEDAERLAAALAARGVEAVRVGPDENLAALLGDRWWTGARG